MALWCCLYYGQKIRFGYVKFHSPWPMFEKNSSDFVELDGLNVSLYQDIRGIPLHQSELVN